MPDKFAKKTFIVTGAASGIGLSTARLLHAKGARLVLWDLNAALLRQAAHELKAERCAVDVAQPEQVRQAMAEAASHTGKIDGASKAGVLNLAQGLRVELAQTRIHIGVVCPHSVDTPMLDAENRKSRFVQRFGTVHTPDQIAQSIVRGIERRQFMILPGLQPRLIFLAAKLLSPSLAHFVMSRLWR
jgi:short-subunit dehydrogenase